MSLRKVKVNRPGTFLTVILVLLFAMVSCAPEKKQEALPTLALQATLPPSQAAAGVQVLIPTFTPAAESTLFAPSPTATNLPPADTPTPFPTAEPITYTVKSGDTLLDIAFAHNVDSGTLMAVNKITDPNSLSVGQVLQIPSPSYTNPGSANKTVPYPVVEGDSFYSIADKFGISPINLQNANPEIETLQVGNILQIPWDGVHIVAWGDTLSAIAVRYGVDFDALVEANIDVLNLDNLNDIQVGWQLTIPVLVVEQNEAGEEIVVTYDCNPLPARNGVIEYTVQNGERLFCLSSKFSVDMPTLLYANPQIIGEGALSDGVIIQVPPRNGALYTVTETDITNNTALTDIASWYGIRVPDTIVDWDGNPISLPLSAGQQLFIPEADPLAGTFNSGVLVAFNAGDQDSIDRPDTGNIVEPGPLPPPDSSGFVGSAPFDGLDARHWNEQVATKSPGYCVWQAGSGWTGSLVWPLDSRDLPDNQRFRPGHAAIDINAPEGSPVYAAESGVVVWAGYSLLGGGSKVILSHGNLWRTHYVHLSSAAVGCGQFVTKGSVIGYSGQTGTSWPHLHFEVNQGSASFDPCSWLSCS